MTQDEIMSMAKEACLPNQTLNTDTEFLTRFAALVVNVVIEKNKIANAVAIQTAVEVENEACAKVCEEVDANNKGFPLNAKTYAAAIRARGEK